MTREVLPLLGPVAERMPWHPRETYLNLSKGFGSVPSDQLMELALTLESSSQHLDLSVAGSAMIEATLFSPYRTEETADDDRHMVEYGIVLLQEAAQACWDDLEQGRRHYNDQTTAIRSEIRAAFGPIYLGLLEGEITQEARAHTYQQLAYWGMYVRGLGENSGENRNGLSYEIATLMGGLTDEAVILPSTPRADSGVYNEHATHDFTYLTLDEDGIIKTNMPLELKNEGDDDRRMANARRYSQDHVVVLNVRKDLHLHVDDLNSIFSQRSLTPQAYRNLASIRNGVYSRVHEAEREWGAEY